MISLWAARTKPGWDPREENSCTARRDQQWQIGESGSFLALTAMGSHSTLTEHVKHLKRRMPCAPQVLVIPHIGKSEMVFPKIGNLQHSHFL